MNKEQAEKLKFFVNDKGTLDALNVYIDYRTEFLKDSLVTAKDIDEVRRLQGAIEEFKRFRHIRDEVNKHGN